MLIVALVAGLYINYTIISPGIFTTCEGQVGSRRLGLATTGTGRVLQAPTGCNELGVLGLVMGKGLGENLTQQIGQSYSDLLRLNDFLNFY